MQDHDHATALPGLAGSAAAPASSALIMPARAFRAWLEPLIPSLRRVRLDTGFPAAVSLLAAWRAWPIPDRLGVAAVASWSCCGAVLVPADGPDAASGAWGAAWSWAGPAWSSEDQSENRGVAGPGVRLPGGSAAVPASARSMWASAVPMPRTRTGRQDTIGGDGPRRPRHPGLGHQVVGDLPGHAEREGADRRPLGEPAGPRR